MVWSYNIFVLCGDQFKLCGEISDCTQKMNSFFRNFLEWSNLARKLVSLKKTFADVFFVSVFLRSVPSFAHLLSFTSLFNDKKKSKHVSKSRRLCVCLGWDWFWLISECYMAQIPLLTASWLIEHLH